MIIPENYKRMKNIILATLLISGIGNAFAVPEMHVDDFSVERGGTWSAPLGIDPAGEPMADYAGFQFDLVVPPAVTVTAVKLGEDMADFTISTRELNGTVRVVAYTTGNHSLSRTEGIATIEVAVSRTAPEGVHTVTIGRSILSSPEGSDIFLGDASFQVTVVPPVLRADTPLQLLRKGDGTSHTFVAMMERPDAALEAAGYHYVFGYTSAAEGTVKLADTPWRYTHTDEEVYWNTDNDFWVFAYYTDSEAGIVASSRRHLDGGVDYDFDPEAIIGAPDGSQAQIRGIYTLEGRYVGDDVDALESGVYVVTTTGNSYKIIKQ